jgi:HTH-type transcriptional regulator/antitoxin HigA
MKELRPICNEKEYAEVLAEISTLIDKDLEKDAKDSGRFELLVGLVEAYEAIHYPINPLSPIDQLNPKIDILWDRQL